MCVFPPTPPSFLPLTPDGFSRVTRPNRTHCPYLMWFPLSWVNEVLVQLMFYARNFAPLSHFHFSFLSNITSYISFARIRTCSRRLKMRNSPLNISRELSNSVPLIKFPNCLLTDKPFSIILVWLTRSYFCRKIFLVSRRNNKTKIRFWSQLTVHVASGKFSFFLCHIFYEPLKSFAVWFVENTFCFRVEIFWDVIEHHPNFIFLWIRTKISRKIHFVFKGATEHFQRITTSLQTSPDALGSSTPNYPFT